MKRSTLLAAAVCGLGLVLSGCDKKADLSTVPVNPGKDDVKVDQKTKMTLPPVPSVPDEKK